MHTRIIAVALVCGGFMAIAGQPPTTWYVDDDGDEANGCTSWFDACPELQTALSLAEPGDQIWVAEGVYLPDYDVDTGQHTGDREATFQLIDVVAIYGGFDGTEGMLQDRAGLFDETILSGDLNGDDDTGGDHSENSYHVTTASGTGLSAILDGFTITAGHASSSAFPHFVGGGMLNEGGSPTVTNCRFSENTARSGGGMYNFASSACTEPGDIEDPSNPELTACTFIGNTALNGGGGAIVNLDGSSPLIKNCLFVHNVAMGAPGVGGSGGAVVNARCCTPMLDSCRFIENSATVNGGGVRSFFHSDAVVTNCTFIGNSAQFEGGAMFNQSSSPTFTNCTFSGNSAAEGSAVRSVLTHQIPSNPILENCILWNNGPAPITQDARSWTMIHYSDVQGGWPGEGNIDLDPLFVDPEGPDDDPDTFEDNDYRLSATSPCIDAADNTAVPDGIVTDLDGNPRFVDDPNTDDTGFGDPPIVDMGAYEVQAPCADDDGDGRITICHVPPGNPDNAHTITVSVRALPAHLAHGDHCGPCEGDGGLPLSSSQSMAVPVGHRFSKTVE